jgi:hypothetical protein
MSKPANPLSKYFRQPQLYIQLPSQGKWYPAGVLDLPVTKELPIFPMTAKDELSMQSPDALLSGQTTVDLIQSCVPNIKNAWLVPTVDLDYLLIAIRRATYGNAMDFTSACPHCKKSNENTINLELLQSQIYNPNFEETLIIDKLELYLQPQNFKQLNVINLQKFEGQKMLKIINDQEQSESDKIKQIEIILKNILEITVQSVSNSILAIKTDDGIVVQEKEFIDDFLRNCKKQVWEQIVNRIESISNQSPMKNIQLVCEYKECNKPYTTPLIFEMSNFFG